MHRKNIFYNYASYLFAGTGLKNNCTNEMAVRMKCAMQLGLIQADVNYIADAIH